MDIVFDPSLVLYVPLYKLDGEQFMSKDAYGHLCITSPNPATAPAWRSSGRDFNGLTDYVTCGSNISLDNAFDRGGTALAWINPRSDGENDHGVIMEKGQWRFNVDDEQAGAVKLRLWYDFDGVSNGEWVTRTATISLNAWHHVAVTYDNSDVGKFPAMYINGILYTLANGIRAITETSAPVGDRDSDAGDVLYIGSEAVGNQVFDGYIGECMLYNRILSPQEIFQNYLATRGRFI